MDLEEEKHEISYSGAGVIDSYKCTCGWESPPYWDGDEYARLDVKKHLKDVAHED